MVLTRDQAKAFYDRFGRRQDTQAFYEDAALDDLIAHAAFEQAGSVFELGCGTGRFAWRLLERHLPAAAAYLGIDLSRTMIDIATQRLRPFAARARVVLSEGAMQFPLPDRSTDRVISCYVLDLLSEADANAAIAEAHRVLTPGGKLCLISLTQGETAASRILCAAWSALFRLHAPLVGGCRPIRLDRYLDPQDWSVEYHLVVTQFAVPSEVLVATPRRLTAS